MVQFHIFYINLYYHINLLCYSCSNFSKGRLKNIPHIIPKFKKKTITNPVISFSFLVNFGFEEANINREPQHIASVIENKAMFIIMMKLLVKKVFNLSALHIKGTKNIILTPKII